MLKIIIIMMMMMMIINTSHEKGQPREVLEEAAMR